MMIKALIFDCFGVLTVDLWKEFVLSLPQETQEPARELNRALDRGQLTLHEFSAEINSLTGREPARVEETIAVGQNSDKNQALLRYIRGVHGTYKIGLLSNISTNWIRDSFLSPDETALFDAFILSYEVGMTKPDPNVYILAAERLSVRPEECIFIDDGEGNCQGARNVGMQSVLYENLQQTIADLNKILKT